MPHKYSEKKLVGKRTQSRLNKVRRTIHKLLVAILYPGDDIESEVDQADIVDAVSYLCETLTQQADNQTTIESKPATGWPIHVIYSVALREWQSRPRDLD